VELGVVEEAVAHSMDLVVAVVAVEVMAAQTEATVVVIVQRGQVVVAGNWEKMVVETASVEADSFAVLADRQ
jgi:hypothetical protein